MLVLSLLLMIFISFSRSWSQASSGTGFVTCRLNILAFPTDKGGEVREMFAQGIPWTVVAVTAGERTKSRFSLRFPGQSWQ